MTAHEESMIPGCEIGFGIRLSDMPVPVAEYLNDLLAAIISHRGLEFEEVDGKQQVPGLSDIVNARLQAGIVSPCGQTACFLQARLDGVGTGRVDGDPDHPTRLEVYCPRSNDPSESYDAFATQGRLCIQSQEEAIGMLTLWPVVTLRQVAADKENLAEAEKVPPEAADNGLADRIAAVRKRIDKHL